MHACLVNNAYIVLSAQEYVENLEGCEALADRLARPSQTGQEEVCHIAFKILLNHQVSFVAIWQGLFQP